MLFFDEFDFIDEDICMCGNAAECPLKEDCRRYRPKKPGIYTMSLFYEEGKECEHFLERRDR